MSAYILIHGAFQGKWCWEKVKYSLEQKNHHVIAVDLPGSGEDMTPPQEVTLKSYTDKVIAVLEKVDSPVILVGHSMAGVVISQVAEYLPKKYKGLFMFLQLCRKMAKVFKILWEMVAQRLSLIRLKKH